ncbi:hypothetical protein HanIR_Chr14g0715231 [Helianthus annuus]|nr:hypothetical protein HanIR_Chr14g0715231 [Helianthus annuus]
MLAMQCVQLSLLLVYLCVHVYCCLVFWRVIGPNYGTKGIWKE